MYYKRPYFELIFMKNNEHQSLHRRAEAQAGKKLFGRLENSSEFGIKFIEHFGIEQRYNKKLRHTEYVWYLRHNNKCRWE